LYPTAAGEWAPSVVIDSGPCTDSLVSFTPYTCLPDYQRLEDTYSDQLCYDADAEISAAGAGAGGVISRTYLERIRSGHDYSGVLYRLEEERLATSRAEAEEEAADAEDKAKAQARMNRARARHFKGASAGPASAWCDENADFTSSAGAPAQLLMPGWRKESIGRGGGGGGGGGDAKTRIQPSRPQTAVPRSATVGAGVGAARGRGRGFAVGTRPHSAFTMPTGGVVQRFRAKTPPNTQTAGQQRSSAQQEQQQQCSSRVPPPSSAPPRR
jgi:hypothetical protein